MDQMEQGQEEILSSPHEDTTSEEKYVTYDELTRKLEEMRRAIQGSGKQSDKEVKPEIQFKSKPEEEPVLEEKLTQRAEPGEMISTDQQVEQIFKEAQEQARKIKAMAVLTKNRISEKIKEIEKSETMQKQQGTILTASKVAAVVIVLLFVVSSRKSRKKQCKS